VSRFLAPSCVVSLALTLSLISVDRAGVEAQTPAPAPAAQAPVATPENVAAFLGDWTLSTTGANGPATTALSIKVDAGKVTAEISSEAQGRIAVTDLKRMGQALLLSYGFDYQGTAVPVVLTLTLAGEKVTAEFDFASGAYLMSGTAMKKK
jgi:hypothetical protein